MIEARDIENDLFRELFGEHITVNKKIRYSR
jgi:hypothetical protein